jgi:hypothetical protein
MSEGKDVEVKCKRCDCCFHREYYGEECPGCGYVNKEKVND